MKKKFKFEPNGFVILVIIMAFCAIMTWIIPAGTFDRVMDETTGREIVVDGTYKTVEATPVGPWQFLLSLFNGFVEASDIIFFIVFASAYVYLLTKIGAINAMTGAVMRKVGKHDNLIIPVFMTLFAIGGTTFGMFEEVYALMPAFIVISITLGYDRIVGGAIVYLGIAIGFAAAVLNPFTIGIASKIAVVPLIEQKVTIFRIVSFVIFLGVSIAYVMRYANKIKKDPSKSILYGVEENIEGLMTKEECMEIPFTKQQKISMFGFVILIGFLVYGIVYKGWYLAEIATLFFVFYVITAFINKMTPNEIAVCFVESTKSTMYGVVMVGFARGIAVVMNAGGITDTVVYGLSKAVSSLPAAFTGIGMLTVQNIINFFIPSGSGQAVVMMPIMAPLSDLVGVSRQMATVAYQFGDGFSNMFWPTAVALECGIMGISLKYWYKFITKLFLMLFLIECLLMVAGIIIGI